MTEIVNLNSENEPAAKFLEPYLQSGNLNFLIGSGASAPAIKTAGNIETEINNLLAANDEAEANKKSLEFITTISVANSKILTTWISNLTLAKVRTNYVHFLSSIDKILFARKKYSSPKASQHFYHQLRRVY